MHNPLVSITQNFKLLKVVHSCAGLFISNLVGNLAHLRNEFHFSEVHGGVNCSG